MDGNQVFILGLGLQLPWKLVSQHLDTSTKPSVLTLNVAADRGSLYPCPCRGKACPAHDFKSLTWRQKLTDRSENHLVLQIFHRLGAAIFQNTNSDRF